MGNFIHLHVHSEFSLDNGMTGIKEMLKCAEKNGQSAIALTDNGVMCGMPRFFREAQRYPDITPIAGCDIFLTDHYDHRLKDGVHNKCYRLVLLAKNYDGYVNLCRISTEGCTAGKFRGIPRVSHEVVASHSEGLICLSAGWKGEVSQRILEDDIQGAEEAVKWYKGVFGDDFYLEVSLHKPSGASDDSGDSGDSGDSSDMSDGGVAALQQKANDGVFRLAEKMSVKVVATNDALFALKEQKVSHRYLLAARSKTPLAYYRYPDYTGEEYLKSEEEMMSLFPEHQEAVSNTAELVSKIEKYEIKRAVHIPHFPLPAIFKNADECLEALVKKRLEERYEGNIPEEATERLAYELMVIREKGCADYFLHLWELVSWAREHNIPVGPGKGSAPSWLVNWCLDICTINPLDAGLLSEKFYNLGRKSIPYISFDFGDDSCATEPNHNIVGHLQDRFGQDHASRIARFDILEDDIALNTAAMLLGRKINKKSRTFDHWRYLSFSYGPHLLAESVETIPEFLNFYQKCNDDFREMIDVARSICGRIYATGIYKPDTNEDNVLITDETNSGAIAMYLDEKSGQLVSQYDQNDVEMCGGICLDLYYLQTLSSLRDILSLIKKKHGVEIDLAAIPLDDNATLDTFRLGDTDGVLYFGGPGMKKNLRLLYPDSINDIAVLIALSPFCDEFIMQKHIGTFDGEIDRISEILSPTYGPIIYQEQMMQIVKEIGLFTPEEADEARKIFIKKRNDEEKINLLYDKFIKNGQEKCEYDKKVLNALWKSIKNSYGACSKSNSLALAILSYQCAYLKTYWPKEFDEVMGITDEI